ncbi:MAG TPA: hypothetical protein VN958_20225 [Chitinophagaceae bacterium]|nr:hypothetical protein [Chitinophagaceae bacterium]
MFVLSDGLHQSLASGHIFTIEYLNYGVMERELILPVKDSNYDKKKVENEIEMMKKLLPYIESFKSFFINNDVFDIRSHKLVTKYNRIRDAFDEGLESLIKYYVFCKN